MPPRKRAAPRADWSWVGTEVHALDQIKAEHRRRAAGLDPSTLVQCPFALHRSYTPVSTISDDVIEVDQTGKPKARPRGRLKVPGCTPKGCRNNPVCYNHLGAEKVFSPDAKKLFLEEHAPTPLEPRKGPAGLRNLGATCYANAFLQLWYHNVSFRNGVYDCVTTEHSDKTVVNPIGLIEALRLGKGEQQDAAEFSKLFMSVLALEFGKHPDPAIKSFLKTQFEGKMQYVTTCECGYQSTTQTTFLELELSLKDKTSLQDCLNALQTPDILVGDNQYQCPACGQRRNAERRQSPVDLPPVLHLSLMRFVFDQATMSRKKTKASITFPKSITLGSQRYELRGVVTHQGTSAHHGHFTCEVFDETEQIWLLCNDEQVTNLSGQTRKKPKLSLASNMSEAETQTSKDAYMLVYKKRIGDDRPKDPPEIVWKGVQADNAAFLEERASAIAGREALGDEFERMNGAKKEILQSLPGLDCIVPRDALDKWLHATASAELSQPFDVDSLLCRHGGVDPTKTGDSRLISRAAFDQLRLLVDVPDLDICAVCVEDAFEAHAAKTELEDRVNTFDRVNTGARNWILPSAWLDQWKEGVLPHGTLPTAGQFSLYCEHGNRGLTPKNGLGRKKDSTVSISDEALVLLRSIVGDFKAFGESERECRECTASRALLADEAEARRLDLKADKAISKHLQKGPRAFALDYYVLPKPFLERWREYMGDKGGVQPILDMGLCEHGMLDYDPEMERREVLLKPGWDILCDKYGSVEPIIVQFAPNTAPGKRIGIAQISHRVCEPCRKARLFRYETVEIPIIANLGESITEIKKPCFPLHNGFDRISRLAFQRSSRSGATREYSVEAVKETTVKDLKVEIMQRTGLSPISQRLFYAGRELASEETLHSMEYLQGDEMILEEVQEVQDIDDDDVTLRHPLRDEGFGGTALLARIACPVCTYENDGGVRACQMCETAFEAIPV
ncbi:hypothetical protein IAU60_003780 [Kwoniella sp. DSM 27419]